ncbi:CMBL [Branchiostoma lanceolatum]|uniref:Carboxymethylenebutenolidase homolog n=1 Tax=Branchiostoma lanceolatum TaxID=7740 RepID=A0A8J9YQR5_BRALA|nr:CMBL [Branchiostoma lanceolatum]
MANGNNETPCCIGDRLEYGSMGRELKVGGVDMYLATPKTPTKKGVVVYIDVYGWKLPNTRYIVDMIANNGYVAILPDAFEGAEPWSADRDWSTFFEWMKTKDANKIHTVADAAVGYLRQECGVEQLGCVGFCWGGRAVHACVVDRTDFKCGVAFYGMRSIDDEKLGLLNAPGLFVFGGKDSVIPLDQVETLKTELKKSCKVEHHVTVYEGMPHGFAHRKKEENDKDAAAIDGARLEMLKWLEKYM